MKKRPETEKRCRGKCEMPESAGTLKFKTNPLDESNSQGCFVPNRFIHWLAATTQQSKWALFSKPISLPFRARQVVLPIRLPADYHFRPSFGFLTPTGDFKVSKSVAVFTSISGVFMSSAT